MTGTSPILDGIEVPDTKPETVGELDDELVVHVNTNSQHRLAAHLDPDCPQLNDSIEKRANVLFDDLKICSYCLFNKYMPERDEPDPEYDHPRQSSGQFGAKLSKTEVLNAIRDIDRPVVIASLIADKTDVSRITARRWLNKLVEDGTLEKWQPNSQVALYYLGESE